jgi:hypothetical protein
VKKIRSILMAGMLTIAATAQADLARVGPVSNVATGGNGFPLWYQDLSGRVLDLCLPNAVDAGGAQLNACLLVPPGPPAPPYIFPTNFPDEVFYFRAVGDPIDMGLGKRAVIVLALEAAFANGAVANGDQMVFTRIRVTAGVPEAGTYTVYHPYGVETFTGVESGVGNRDIVFSEDVGLVAGNFTDALHSRLGPNYLMPADSTGAQLPPVSVNGALFLSDGTASVNVTGSPFNQNYVMICGVRDDGTDIPLGTAGASGSCVRSDLFALTGRLHDNVASPIGSPLDITRATYSRDSVSGTRIDVHASVAKVLASQPNPLLTAAAESAAPARMVGPDALGAYFTQALNVPSGSIPGSVTVTNSADNPPTPATAKVTDQVTISSAEFNATTGILRVIAASSDKGFGASPAPTLTLQVPGSTVPLAAGFASIPGIRVSPLTVTVASAAGGVARAEVLSTGMGTYAPGSPLARDDNALAVASGSPVAINLIGNDVFATTGAATVTILPGLTPGMGTLSAPSASGVVTFTPSALTGTATFKYTVTQAGIAGASNPATVTITVAPPAGGTPLAVADSVANPVNVGASIGIDVTANDSGNGGTLSRGTVLTSNVTGGTTSVNTTTGVVTFTAGTTAGTFGFDYTVANTNGIRSAPAHVTVTVIQPEQVAIVAASCRISTREWRLTGTSTITVNNAITAYNTATAPIAPTAAQTIGSSPVLANSWDIRVRPGAACPTTVNPRVSLRTSIGTVVNNVPLTIRN